MNDYFCFQSDAKWRLCGAFLLKSLALNVSWFETHFVSMRENESHLKRIDMGKQQDQLWLTVCVVYRYDAFNWLLDSSFPAVMEKSINASHWNMSSTQEYIPSVFELCWAVVRVGVSSGFCDSDFSKNSCLRLHSVLFHLEVVTVQCFNQEEIDRPRDKYWSHKNHDCKWVISAVVAPLEPQTMAVWKQGRQGRLCEGCLWSFWVFF